ncbi:SWI/SNF-related matrix-associated actin-dependent regulator of chromatin subfamily A-like protein 1 [Copidosoma floridanum]|uniref:SWI/SNF-related matrix-associated actin-dependent regulator of chromatin subfamily A-like protein 1 n=1 Tax=Copidosoma floridanum TaxID=29053 RepID=UPI0006C94196|nr:SWI/SNF-related matrix-associated actin-dependent regulator of chromatin subfamily A-like protein 1 [Copidosoma floridanum]
MYSKEEIERKRLEALKRMQQKTVTSSGSVSTPNVTKPPAISNFINQNQSSYYRNNENYSSKPNFTNENYQNKSKRVFKQQGVSNRYSPMQRPNNFYGNQQPMCEATCVMLTNNRFAVETSSYHQKLIDLLKTIPSRLYDTQTKTWNFHFQDYETLQQKISALQAEVTFKPFPIFVVKAFKKLSAQEKEPKKDVNFSQIDSALMDSLYPFQIEGIKFGILNDGKCLIADDMGLGKTRQALGIACYFKKDWPLIIITPSSVRYQWSEAIIESLPSVLVQSIQHITNTRDLMERSQVTIISYDLLVKRIDEIAAKKFGVVICDESHYLKSGKTQRTKAVQRLVANCPRVILLTGTPALSRPIELHPQIKMVMPSFMSYKDYGIRYCAGVQNKFGWDFSGSSNLKELEMLLKACCLIRRLKTDVMTQLPSKIKQKIILDPQLIKAATEEMKSASKKLEESKDNSKKRSALLQYYSASSKAKEKAVCNYITDLIESQQKFLVFAHHQNMLDAISNLLATKKIMYIRIDGKTNPEQRKYFVDQFQKSEKTLAAVLSITAANAGITMTAAQIVIFAELFWNPGILNQAEDRVHRIGQTSNVVIRYLLAKETVDDYLWPAILRKVDILSEFGLDQNLDLDKACVENQPAATSNQPKIDNFFTSPNKQSANSSKIEPTGNADLSNGNLKDLLNMDDEAFEDIDLDQLEN